MTPSRNAVGVYDRPHPLRTRRALVAAGIAIIVAVGYAMWFYLG
jgi:HAMP domain-containing protein